jgi:hypothetical protein
MADNIRIGPKFYGMTDNPFADDGRCVLSVNFIPRGDRLQRRLGWSTVASNVKGDLGVRGFGTKRGASTIVAMSAYGLNTKATILSGYGTNVVYPDGESPKGIYTFAAMGGYLYASAGHNLLKIDASRLTCEKVAFTAGLTSATNSYLAEAPPARSICSHLGRMWFAGFESADLAIHGLTSQDSPYTDDDTWIASSTRVNYKPFHIVFSDPYKPNQIPSLNNFAVEDDGNAVVAIHPFGGGLLVLTEASAWFLSGTNYSTWRLDKLGTAGCISPTSVSAGPDTIYWLGPNAIYYMGTDLVPKQVEGIDWIWNGDKPLFAALTGSNNETFPVGLFGLVSNPTQQANACGVFDAKQGGYLVTRLIGKPDTEECSVGVWIDDATKTPVFLSDQPRVIGSAMNTDLGSTVSDILAAETYTFIGISDIMAWKGGVYTDEISSGVRRVAKPAYYISCFKEGGSYLNADAVRVFCHPQELYVNVLSWERSADPITPAGSTLAQGVTGQGTTAPDVFGDENLSPRVTAQTATTGDRWLYETDTTGLRYPAETPGTFRVPVLGHGRALAVTVYDQQTNPSPILGLSLDVNPVGS